MITYETAVKLKEAGFDQREYLLKSADDVAEAPRVRDIALMFHRDDCGYHRTFDLSLIGYPETEPDYYTQGKWRSSSIFSKEYLESDEGKKDTVYFPVLSELIEACEIKEFLFRVTFSQGDNWEASTDKNGKWTYGCGLTPEEAVANLWLVLNGSKT